MMEKNRKFQLKKNVINNFDENGKSLHKKRKKIRDISASDALDKRVKGKHDKFAWC